MRELACRVFVAFGITGTVLTGIAGPCLFCGCAGSAGRDNVWVPLPYPSAEASGRMREGKEAIKGIRTAWALEHHSATVMGLTMSHVKFTIDSEVLQRVLDKVRESGVYFSTDYDTGHAFGPESNRTWDVESDGLTELPWWRPWDELEPEYCRWWMHEPGTLETRVWLQISDAGRSRKLVYMRVESG